MSTAERPWLQPGQRVAVRSFDGWRNSWSAAVVERHTSTQIVTDVGRFWLDTLRAMGKHYTELRPITDPGYVASRAENALDDLRYKIGKLQRGRIDTAQDALTAVEGILALAEQAKRNIQTVLMEGTADISTEIGEQQ
jgi:hypothetical protein